VHIGPDSLLVAAKIAVRPEDTAGQIVAGIDAAEKRVRAAVPIATTIYLEPDIYQRSQADLSDPSIRSALRGRLSRRRGRAAPPVNGGAARPPTPPRDTQ
jgi:hypothetical protein